MQLAWIRFQEGEAERICDGGGEQRFAGEHRVRVS